MATAAQIANPSSVYSMAASMGYPYLRGEGRVAKNDRTWLSRVTQKSDGSGPAIYVGWDSITRKWIVEKESGADYEAGPRIGRGGNPHMQVSFDPGIKKYLAFMYDAKFGNLYATGFTKKEAAKALREVWRKARATGSWRNPENPRLPPGKMLTNKQKNFYLAQYDYWLNVQGSTEEKSEKYALEDLLKAFPRLAKKNPFDWREHREKTGTIIDEIRHGDRVTIVDRFGQSRSGKAVMRGPAGWVLNLGGAHGTPGIATAENIVKVRKSNPTKAPRPRKGESVPDYHARRVRELLAKMPKPIRDVFDRNPATYKFVFRNPSSDDELDEAENLYQEFHGRAPREILEMQESSETRGEYTALGDLIELTMIAPTGDHVMVKFKSDGVRLASSPNGEQLYLLGGNQDITESLGMFGADDAKDLIDLGEAKQIVYEASKWQTNFDPQEWKHDFGEESGVRPRGFYDQLKKRIFFAGGNYKVKRPGIVD